MIITTDELEDLALAANLEAENVRTDYSGRGMYGRHCVGFVLDGVTDMLTLGAALRDVLGFIPGAATDSMGRGMILYFPQLQIEDEEDPELDPEDQDDDS